MSASYLRLRCLFSFCFTLLFGVAVTTSASEGISSVTTCNCLGQNVTLQCTTVGGAFTVWAGNAFMCQAGEISLRHVEFLDSIGACNDNAIIARGVSVQSNQFTSHLNITLTSELVGRTVTCSLDDGESVSVIGTTNLTQTTTNSFPPLSMIYIEHIGPNQIFFSWSAIPNQESCPLFVYNISAINCGMCSPSITTSNSSNCTNFMATAYADHNQCNFTVRSVICGNIPGNSSYHLVNLAVPAAPVVLSVPHYAFRARNLIRLETSIQLTESFNISNTQGIDGSAISYTIVYAEFPSGRVCNSFTIMASSCETGIICNHTFEILSSSSCPSSSNITTTVFASNVLGNGSGSIPIVTGGINSFVEVSFNLSTKTIMCFFPNQSMSKQCIANITYGTNCDQHLGVYQADDGEGSSVITHAIDFKDEVSSYCLVVSASSSIGTVIVEGNLDLVNIRQQSVTAAVASSVVVILFSCCIIAVIVILMYAISIHKRVRTIKFTNHEKSFMEVFQVFKNRGVSILGLNTHLHHAGVNLETTPGFTDNYIFCTCSNKEKDKLKSELTRFNIDFLTEGSQDDNTLTIVKIPINNSTGSIDEALNVFKRNGIKISGINTPTGDDNIKSVMCKCSKLEETGILKDLKKMDSESTDFIPSIVSTSRPLTRRINFLVRSEAAGDIARALNVFRDCSVNITQINPDHLITSDTPKGINILEVNNLVECICNEGTRKTLFTKLGEEYKAYNIRCLPEKDLPSRSSINQDYCVVAFSVVHQSGSLATALMAFVDLDINILGINTLGCADLSTLQEHISYKRYTLKTNEQQVKVSLIKEIQGTGVVVDSETSTNRAVEETTGQLNLLIEENKISAGIPEPLQTVFTILKESGVTVTGFETDCSGSDSTCQVERQYQHNHVEYDCTNEEHYRLLIKELTATGIVKVLKDFEVDDGSKIHFRSPSITCTS